MTETIIGIDLGTTNSEVAIVENGQVTVITDEGKKILPSFVGITDNHEVLVGESARNQYLVYPESTVKSIKRRMGEDVKIDLAGQQFSPQEISAIILKRLKQIAEKHLQKPVTKAVITVPAYFSDAQRQATREAGEIAGLEVVRMINEPTAAALAYGAGQEQEKCMLVYDLGGGTFDVSVVNIQNGVTEVLSSHGNNKLGGDDFDEKIINHLVHHLNKTYDTDVTAHRKAMARITRAAETAKKLLSDMPFVQVEEEYLFEHQGTAVHLSLELARSSYEALIEDYISETLDAVHIALKGANLTVSDIDEILLVGGATRTPCIRERLHEVFGFEAHSEVDPDLCVAMGAAVQAAMISGDNVDSVLVDVTPYTYGTSAVGEFNGELYPFVYAPIIRKNSTIPLSKTEAFCTMYDGQKAVEVSVYQGEDPDALNNVKIGEFLIEGLKNVSAGNVITTTFSLDLNGMLHVSSKEKITGLEKSITIKNALAKFEAHEIHSAKTRLDKLFGQNDFSARDDDDDEELAENISPATLAAQNLIVKAEALLDSASAEDKEDMVNLIEQINAALEENVLDSVTEALEKLTDIIYYLES